jgi:hypothetical protein
VELNPFANGAPGTGGRAWARSVDTHGTCLVAS